MAVIQYSPSTCISLETEIMDALKLVICIPCYNEQHIVETLLSLQSAAAYYGDFVEVIILINEEMDGEYSTVLQNQKTYDDIAQFSETNHLLTLKIYPIYVKGIDLKSKGVGLARKLAMDCASKRFLKGDGLIVCLDADCTVADNYIKAIVEGFANNMDIDAMSIYFEHPLNAENMDSKTLEAIVAYELHLRVFINMQRWIRLPFAYQTIGSAMAVRAHAYIKSGGMNKRKAGEDFYFLHKFIKNDKCGEILNTTVYPSSRKSDRVPFGTGRAMIQIMEGQKVQKTYHPISFVLLEKLLSHLNRWYLKENLVDELIDTDPVVLSFFQKYKLAEKIQEIRSNVTSKKMFRKRFYQWFDAFLFMKYMHYMRDHLHDDVDIPSSVRYLFDRLEIPFSQDPVRNLLSLRAFDQQHPYTSVELL